MRYKIMHKGTDEVAGTFRVENARVIAESGIALDIDGFHFSHHIREMEEDEFNIVSRFRKPETDEEALAAFVRYLPMELVEVKRADVPKL